jgi:hypothetical protein
MAKKEKKKVNLIYIILITLIVICIGIIIALVIKNEKTLTPDFAPGTIDTNAIKEESKGDKMNVNQGGGAVSLSYSNIVAIDSSKKDIKMYFKNPSKSRESMVLEIVIKQKEEEFVLSKSDLLPPGYALYNMKLNTNTNIPAGGYNGIFRVTYYDEETGAKQIVNTEIEVSIEVK